MCAYKNQLYPKSASSAEACEVPEVMDWFYTLQLLASGLKVANKIEVAETRLLYKK